MQVCITFHRLAPSSLPAMAWKPGPYPYILSLPFQINVSIFWRGFSSTLAPFETELSRRFQEVSGELSGGQNSPRSRYKAEKTDDNSTATAAGPTSNSAGIMHSKLKLKRRAEKAKKIEKIVARHLRASNSAGIMHSFWNTSSPLPAHADAGSSAAFSATSML